MSATVRVLIADDSPTVRQVLALLLAGEVRIELVGQARDGAEAVALATQLRPDVMTMDIEMPVLDGLGAIEQIMERCPTRILVVCAAAQERLLDLSFRAIAAGALELLAKPAVADGDSDEQQGERLRKFGEAVRRAILLMAEVPVVRRPRPAGRSSEPTARTQRVDAIGIAASTGGPPALALLLGALPASLPVPILIAQHIAPGFSEGLMRWLARSCALPVRAARDGAACEPGTIYLPPEGCDLLVDRARGLRTPLASGPHRPSANLLFSSLATAYGARAAGFILTGMGDDGTEGLLALRRAGGPTFAQEEPSCAVFGMPRAAQDAGAVNELVSLERMSRLIVELS